MTEATDLADLSATELLPLFRSQSVSPVEVARAVLARIDAFAGPLHPFVLVDADATLRDAAAAEARWRDGRPLGPIDGVPTTIKDLLLTRGWPTLRGSRTTERAQAWDVDAPAVARLREQGAVLIGKTATPEFGWKGVTDSALEGITRNPWNPECTPGGSSGGAAVAAALGMGCLHVGTDVGGSIRIPAAFTGVFGIKPTFGLVPAWPLSPFGTVAHIGPITRSVSDAAAMLGVLAGADGRDWHSLPPACHDYTAGLDDGVRGLRVALSLRLGYVRGLEAQVEARVRAAADVLASLGAIVEEVDPGFADPTPIFEAHWLSGAANLRRSIAPEKWPLLDPGLTRFADAGEKIDHMDYLRAIDQRGALGLQMALFHQRYDVLLTPTLPITAFEAGRNAPPRSADPSDWVPWAPYNFPFNLTQQPAASIPCGLGDDGLPIGLQIVAAKYRDDLVLRVARAYEREHPIVAPPLRARASGAAVA